MNILLISECTGNAIKETRRILDQFSQRRGVRTWQTPITKAGRDTLHRLLRQTARKNTAVACYWIRGVDHTELLWIVGAASRFNAQGVVPTNETTRNILRSKDENDWRTLSEIHLLSSIAALWHDLGKACTQFQQRLKKPSMERNLIRHEWISLRLFQAFVGQDDDVTWLTRLAEQNISTPDCLQSLQSDGQGALSPNPFPALPPLARVIGWLIITHHRLPVRPGDKNTGLQAAMLENVQNNITAFWNEPSDLSDLHKVTQYWEFAKKLPVDVSSWQERAAKHAKKLLERLSSRPIQLDNQYVLHLARLSLTLADHSFSGIDFSENRKTAPDSKQFFANTAKGVLNQALEEHLLGVERLCGHIAHALPKLTNELPRLVRHKGLRRRTKTERFKWQDKAFDAAMSIREKAANQGAFIVNMASTGCGKTLGNARIMYALAGESQGMRCAFALGLRTLTLQTGREYRERLNLSENEVAVCVGGSASRALFEHFSQESSGESFGAESAQSLLPGDGHVVFEGNMDAHPVLSRIVKDAQVRAMLAAPIVSCTIDHLIPATESLRGGHQIVPMLRLLTSDLVLDELDDYDIDDLPAIARLVHWAGMLGSRVLISSATLPPGLVTGMFEAYLEGRRIFQHNRGEQLNAPLSVCSIWTDEFHVHTNDCSDVTVFMQGHADFVNKRIEQISLAPALRKGALLLVPDSISGDFKKTCENFSQIILKGAMDLHTKHHSTDPITQTKVSFGLVRMANIRPLREIAHYLFTQEISGPIRIHLCVYHSQFPLLMRSAIEQRLDRVLNRKNPLAVFDTPDIRALLDAEPNLEHIFMVLGSPVTEVGRDHDYDWAVVEPSSMRSIIQLAGRIRRHRPCTCTEPNIFILSRNVKSIINPGKAAFLKPGFESEASIFKLQHHDLKHILHPEHYEIITARPRIVAPEKPNAAQSLVDLEHARVARIMQGEAVRPLSARELRAGKKPVSSVGAYSWWRMPGSMLSGILQKEQPFRKQTRPEVDLALLPDEDEQHWVLNKIQRDYAHTSYAPQPQDELLTEIGINFSGMVCPWGQISYMEILTGLAEEMDMDLHTCAKKFGTLSLPQSTQGWTFHPALGFGEKK
ncbi:MAG: type I-F CRISPR-associated helicase Cas3 [Desulfovibrionales bacterium]|nr:type I-F CRISPR-associated helicase Cas3 [Desulfovibrionales bacterium]